MSETPQPISEHSSVPSGQEDDSQNLVEHAHESALLENRFRDMPENHPVDEEEEESEEL